MCDGDYDEAWDLLSKRTKNYYVNKRMFEMAEGDGWSKNDVEVGDVTEEKEDGETIYYYDCLVDGKKDGRIKIIKEDGDWVVSKRH